ncbi:MAG: TlpA disulfide reductase family protein [bacterium]
MTEQPQSVSPRARATGVALLGLVLVLFAANLVWVIRNCDGLRSVGPGSAAPDFALPTLAGDRVHLKALRGRVVLIDFWSVTCAPCWDGLGHLNELQTRYANKPVSLLAVHVQGNRRARQRAQQAAAELKLRMPVLLDTDRISDKYTVRVLPTIVLIGKDGNIRKVWRGLTPTRTLAAAIDEALEK